MYACMLFRSTVIGSIPHGGPIELFLVPGRGMCYPLCGIIHIKEPLLLIGKNNPCGYNLSRYLSGLLPYVRRHLMC